MHVTVYSPFFFIEMTITGIVYDQERRIHFQQDGATPHYFEEVREYLNTRFPGRWIGRAAPIAWPPCSPALTPLDLVFVMGIR
jgi:hypothetical protein